MLHMGGGSPPWRDSSNGQERTEIRQHSDWPWGNQGGFPGGAKATQKPGSSVLLPFTVNRGFCLPAGDRAAPAASPAQGSLGPSLIRYRVHFTERGL